jgi:hypothetical protein
MSQSKIKSVKLSKSSLTLTVGKTYTLGVIINGRSSGRLTWSSSNKKVATVSNSGKVMALRAGSSTIMVNVGGKTATCNITVDKVTTVKTNGTIKSINAVSVSTTVGTEPILPTTVTVVLVNGKNSRASVTWANISSSEYASEGTFTVSGTVSGTSIQAVATVTVTDDTIASIDAVSVSTTVGTEPILPTTVTAVLEDDSTESVPVTWASISSSEYAEEGTFTVLGTVSGSSIQAVATVTVTDDTIASIDAVSVSTTVATEPTLPTTVTAVLEDGSVESVPVTWASISSSEYASEGSFTVYGTVSGASIQAVATVTVTDDTIASIDAVSVSTTVGTEPTLPTTVTAVLEDGSVESVPVTWASISSYLYSSEGSFMVYGTVSGSSIQAVATVTVTAS